MSKLEAMPGGELRRSRLPSGWTPIELLKHVAHDELRWLEWRFEGPSSAAIDLVPSPQRNSSISQDSGNRAPCLPDAKMSQLTDTKKLVYNELIHVIF